MSAPVPLDLSAGIRSRIRLGALRDYPKPRLTVAVLIGFSGVAAVLAGILRTIAAFVPETVPISPREPLYIATDVLILFAIIGLYSRIYGSAGWAGMCGFVLAVIGIGVILSPDRLFLGVPIYPIRAMTFLVGLNTMAASSRRCGRLPLWVTWGWAVSTVVGVVGFAGAPVLVVTAGIIFGVSFAGMGASLIRSRNVE